MTEPATVYAPAVAPLAPLAVFVRGYAAQPDRMRAPLRHVRGYRVAPLAAVAAASDGSGGTTEPTEPGGTDGTTTEPELIRPLLGLLHPPGRRGRRATS